jgi:hypothetical protein
MISAPGGGLSDSLSFRQPYNGALQFLSLCEAHDIKLIVNIRQQKLNPRNSPRRCSEIPTKSLMFSTVVIGTLKTDTSTYYACMPFMNFDELQLKSSHYGNKSSNALYVIAYLACDWRKRNANLSIRRTQPPPPDNHEM